MKKLFSLLVFFFILLNAYAQGGWEKFICLDDIQHEAVSHYEAANGNILIAFNTYDIQNGDSISEIRIRLIWLDADGQTLSIHDIDQGDYLIQQARKIIRLDDGNFLIIGRKAATFDSLQEIIILKVSPTGTILEEHLYGEPEFQYGLPYIEVRDNNIFAIGSKIYIDQDSTDNIPFLIKFNTNGDFISINNLESITELDATILDAQITNEYIHILSILQGSDSTHLSKYDFDGNIVNEYFHVNTNDSTTLSPRELQAHPDGGIAFFAIERPVLPTSNFYRKYTLHKYSETMEPEWIKVIDSIPFSSNNGLGSGYSFKLTLDEANNFITLVTNWSSLGAPFPVDYSYRRFTRTAPDGEELLSQETDLGSHIEFYSIFNQLNNGGFLIGAGTAIYNPFDPSQFDGNCAFVSRLDSNGIALSNKISGSIVLDADTDCSPSPSEPGLENWLVEAQNGTLSYYGFTDTLGKYSIDLGLGDYFVSAIPISDYWLTCEENVEVNLSTISESAVVNFAAQSEVDCPAMWVDISTLALRPCMESAYNVNYCNFGTVTESEAYIEIKLPEELTFINAEIPHALLPDNTLLFEIGDLGISECSDFEFTVMVDCNTVELGETLCTEAKIYPDSICNPSSLWSGASIIVSGMCIENDSIQFTLSNVGTAPTSIPLEYIVVEDQVIMMQEQFTLPESESINITLPATGGTFRVESEQEPNHPGNSMPSFAIEGCGGLTPGMVNLFPMDDGNPFIDIDCRTVTGSFDPNDKTGFPLGREDENIIEQNTDIEYLIRFQNTGTDTAFTVVIRDTLSPYLVPTTVRPGASSHDYNFEILTNGVLKFTFLNILLPDSTTNLEASNGFVEFKIKQQLDNPLGTLIKNTAAIYFDFNDPVITNETKHTIGEALISDLIDLTGSDILIESKVFPNPFLESTTIEIQNYLFQSGRLELFNINDNYSERKPSQKRSSTWSVKT